TEAFLSFSKWVKRGNDVGMKKFADPAYVQRLLNSYDGAFLLSEIWPVDPAVVEVIDENGVKNLTVEARNFKNEIVTGSFQVKKVDELWKVTDGYWRRN
ncbi:hypothetical protein BVX98_07535, partial [bacterium F11]